MTNLFASFKKSIGQMVQKFVFACSSRKVTINKIYFVSIIIYFFLVFLPNITANSPLSFLNYGLVKILFRVVIAVVFGVLSLLSFAANGIKINKLLIISLFCFLLFLFIGPLLNLQAIVSRPFYNNYYEKVVITSTTGLLDLLSYYGNLVFSYVFCFALFTIIPAVMEEKKRFLILINSFIVLMLILCLISYIKDFKLYIAALRFDYNQYGTKDISSLFASKNAFGIFLFQGIVATSIAHHFSQNSKYRLVYIIVFVLFSITMLFSLCKDAIFAAAIFIIVFFVYFLQKKPKKTHDIIGTLIWLVTLILAVALFLLLLFQQNLIVYPFFKKLFYFLGANPVNGNDNALLGRLEIVLVFFFGISGIHYLVGYGHALPSNTYIWTLTYRNSGNDNLHNTFLHMFGTGGILYFLFYIVLLIIAYRNIYKLDKFDKKICLILLGLIIAHTFYSLFETSILFLSGSSGTMFISIVIFTLIYKVKSDGKKENISFYEVKV